MATMYRLVIIGFAGEAGPPAGAKPQKSKNPAQPFYVFELETEDLTEVRIEVLKAEAAARSDHFIEIGRDLRMREEDEEIWTPATDLVAR
jgi:hypothetical protein